LFDISIIIEIYISSNLIGTEKAKPDAFDTRSWDCVTSRTERWLQARYRSCVEYSPMENVMKKLLIATAACCALFGQAHAEGCLKGAVVGGVVGHVAGEHAVIGGAAGCAVGVHHAKKKEEEKEKKEKEQEQRAREQQQQQQSQQQPSSNQ
jgi:hypothetical protein